MRIAKCLMDGQSKQMLDILFHKSSPHAHGSGELKDNTVWKLFFSYTGFFHSRFTRNMIYYTLIMTKLSSNLDSILMVT